MYKSDTKIKVRYAETDQMAIVHHANYYVYFETAREDFILGTGMKYRDMEDIGIMMPLAETQCKYREGAKYADLLIVETSMLNLSPVKVELEYNVIRQTDRKLLATGRTVQTFVDKSSFKIINLKKLFPDIWNKFEKLK